MNYTILETPVCDQNYDQTSDTIISWAKLGCSRAVGVCNVHSVTTSLWDPELKQALLQSDLNTADGMPLVWVQRLMGSRHASRVYGPTLMLYLLAHAQHEKLRVAFYGGHADRLKTLLHNLNQRFPNLEIVEAISPPFGTISEEEQQNLIGKLQAAKPQLIFVGLGCPKQEKWMIRHRESLKAVLVGVGAAFDFHANAVPQAPALLQKAGFEWAYRLYREPRRLIKRYLTTNPVFIAAACVQVIKHHVFRLKTTLHPLANQNVLYRG